MDSLWTKNRTPLDFPSLKGDISTDVLIIGGGMAGVLCARELTARGIDCALVEAKTVGSGVTCGTTAVLTAQHDTLYTKLINRFGRERARQYLHANLDAVERFRTLAQRIPCDFEDTPSVMYSLTDEEEFRREAEVLRSLGFHAEFQKKTRLPFDVAGAVRFPGMAQFHPLKFLCGAARGLNIYQHTFVRKINAGIAITDNGNIRANKIIIATHFPFINKHGLYFMKMYQTRSFVIALSDAPELGGTYVDASENGMYFRNYGGLLLVGGGDRRTGKDAGDFNKVRDFIRHYFGQTTEKYAWAAQDCTRLDGVPYIGRYSPSMPNLYVATGFNEWGMTSSMAASSILSDLIQGKENPYAPVFSPQRSMLRPQLFANLGATLVNFVTPTTKRCPHLGCALQWNKAEKSWGCPCHGSRFDERGRLIDNPAMRDAKIKEK